MTNIGILTCSNSTQDVGCSSFGCLNAAYDREGTFAQYPEGVRIKGIINCAGCPGLRGHDKILKRVRALVASGVEAIHLGACMVMGCPFVAKYEKAINQAYPDLKVVRGTHAAPPAELADLLMQKLTDRLVAQGETVPEIAMTARKALNID
jgi:predicted metal-binding protein